MEGLDKNEIRILNKFNSLIDCKVDSELLFEYLSKHREMLNFNKGQCWQLPENKNAPDTVFYPTIVFYRLLGMIEREELVLKE